MWQRQTPKFALAFCVLLLLLALSGCQGVYTKIPLEAAATDPRVPGVWKVEGETDTIEIRLDGEEYVAQPLEDAEKPLRFRLVRVGEALYAQSGGKPCEAFPSEAECYALTRLIFDGMDTAYLVDFDTAAMFHASLREDFGVGYELRRKVSTAQPPPTPLITVTNEFLLLSRDPAQLRAFVAKYGERFAGSTRRVKYRRVTTPKAP